MEQNSIVDTYTLFLTVRKQLVALLARLITVISFAIAQIGIYCPRIRIVSSLYS